MSRPAAEHTRPWKRSVRAARRLGVALIGGTLVVTGMAMLVLPGPALVVIPAGLAVLGLEFAWARHWMKRAIEQAESLATRYRGRSGTSPPD